MRGIYTKVWSGCAAGASLMGLFAIPAQAQQAQQAQTTTPATVGGVAATPDATNGQTFKTRAAAIAALPRACRNSSSSRGAGDSSTTF